MQNFINGQVLTADELLAFTQTTDILSDWIVSGLIGTVPSPASLTMTLPGGDAYIQGQATVIASSQAQQTNTYAASTTTYVDIAPSGVYTYTTSSTVTAGSTRIQSVTTSSTAITAVTQILPSSPSVTLDNITATEATIPTIGTTTLTATGGTITTLSAPTLTSTNASATTLTAGNVVNNVATTTLDGTTAGTIVYAQTAGTIKKFVGVASGYENDTTTAQAITFPVAFTNTPVVVANTTGLTVSVTTTTLTITAPDATTTYSGTLIVEGI